MQMAFQAIIDDSYDQNGTFVLGGFIASAQAWAIFSKEWQELLPYGTLNKHGRYHFKMKEMAETPERMARVRAFYRIIEKNVLIALSCKIDQAELARARNRIWVPNLRIDWDYLNNPYMVAFRCLMEMFHKNRDQIHKIIPAEESIDFIFDRQRESGSIRDMWTTYVANRDEDVRHRYGVMPRFDDDEVCLPLQAADFWAWWVRKWWNEGKSDKMEICDFGGWQEKRKYPRVAISYGEEQLVDTIRSLMRPMLEPGRIIYDVRFSDLSA
jgi:hypothetical protein